MKRVVKIVVKLLVIAFQKLPIIILRRIINAPRVMNQSLPKTNIVWFHSNEDPINSRTLALKIMLISILIITQPKEYEQINLVIHTYIKSCVTLVAIQPNGI